MIITVIQLTVNEAVIARFQHQRTGLQFLKGVRHDLAETSLATILSQWPPLADGEKVILAVPPSLLFMREVDLPLTDRKKAREILPLELKGEVALDHEDLVFEALPLGAGKTLAIWSSQSRLGQLIGQLAEKGLEPQIVTAALFSWQHLLPADTSLPLALTDGEAVAVYQEGRPLYFRTLPTAGSHDLSVTLAALEISKTIQVEQVLSLSGQCPDETGLDIVPLPINGALAASFPGDRQTAAELASLFSLAKEAVSSDPLNLRRGPLAFTRQQSALQKKLLLTYALAALLVLTLFAEAGVRYYLVRKEINTINSAIRSSYKEIFPTRSKPVDEVAEVKAEIKRLGNTATSGVLVTLRRLAEAKGEELGELYEIDIDSRQISGKGTARTIQGVNDFKNKAIPLIGNLEITEIKSKPDGSVGFSFRSSSKEVSR
jgi:general secretion pathway protein L